MNTPDNLSITRAKNSPPKVSATTLPSKKYNFMMTMIDGYIGADFVVDGVMIDRAIHKDTPVYLTISHLQWLGKKFPHLEVELTTCYDAVANWLIREHAASLLKTKESE